MPRGAKALFGMRARFEDQLAQSCGRRTNLTGVGADDLMDSEIGVPGKGARQITSRATPLLDPRKIAVGNYMS
jgi:hypothetical protein